jgi:hypothetical protein
MFDYLRSSYNLGEHFTDTELHTKDIENCIGGTMTQYWIDPSGQLFEVDYRNTYDIVDTIRPVTYEPKRWFSPFTCVPNGNHGKVSPLYLTKYIIVYPSNWEGNYENWPECRIHFKLGKIQDFNYDTKKFR